MHSQFGTLERVSFYVKFMNKTQADLKNYQNALYVEISSNNTAEDSAQMLSDWRARSEDDRWGIYTSVFTTIRYNDNNIGGEPIIIKLQHMLDIVDDPLFHFTAAIESINHPIVFFNVLNAVNLSALDTEQQSVVVGNLVRNPNDLFNGKRHMSFLLERYAHLKLGIQQHRQNVAIYAAQNGNTDVLDLINWTPENPTQQKNFFMACCIGGLTQWVEKMNISDTATLHEGLLKALRCKHQPVAKQIALKAIQWNNVKSFEPLLYADKELFTTLLAHYTTHPKCPILMRDVASSILMLGVGDFRKILQNVPVEGLESMVKTVVAARSKKNTKALLEHIGDQRFNKGLEVLDPKRIQWAQTYRAQLQQRVLEKEVKVTPVVVRKSKM